MSTPPRLNSAQYAALLDEVAAMVAARQPLVPGLRTLEDRQLGRIGRTARVLRGHLQRGRSVDQALETLDPRVGPQLAAAFRIAADSGDAGPLHRLAELLRQRREVTVAARLALLYPIMLLVLAYAILVLVFAPLVTQEQTALAIWPPPVVRSGQWIIDYWSLPPLVLAVLVVVIWQGARRMPVASLHALLPGRYGRLSLFCHTLALQMEAGMSQPSALRAAAQLCGDRPLARAATRLAARIERGDSPTDDAGAASHDAGHRQVMPPMLAWLLRQTASMAAESTRAQLSMLGRWYAQRERDHRRFWIRWLPGALAAVIGGGFVLVYLFMALRPVYHQLATVG